MPDPVAVLAWRPFLDPIDLHDAWFWLLIPLALLIAIAYKAVRVPDIANFWRQTLLFSAQIILGIVGLFAAALVTLNVILPFWV
tara:strand:+ start:31 stop:282 length:252 start_codon:yes stop_codon:yes gene_type:complete